MKRVLSFVAALAVVSTSIAPSAFAANRLGVPDGSVSDIPLKIESTYDFWVESDSKYATHTEESPMKADVATANASTKFSSKATLDMTKVAEKWKEYTAIAKNGGVVLSDDNTTLTGQFVVTVEYDNGISNSAPTLILSEETDNHFDLDAVDTAVDGVMKATFSLNSRYSDLADYFEADVVTPLVITILSSTVSNVSETAYEVTAELTGNVSINNGTFNVSFESEKAADYVQLIMPKPYVEPEIPPTTAPDEPTATPVPTIRPVAAETVNVGESYTDLGDVEEIEDEDAYNGFDKDQDIQAVVVDVKTEDGEAAVYGEDYYASYGTIPLTERDYELIKSGQTGEVSDEVKDAIGDKTLDEILKDVDIVTGKGSNVTIEIAPVYEDKDGNKQVLEGLGTKTETGTGEPTPVPTRRPSGGGGGGGGARATATPTAKPFVAATSMPLKDTMEEGYNDPEVIEEKGDITGFSIESKKSDGTDGVYGEDYTITDKDGNVLTPAQVNAMLANPDMDPDNYTVNVADGVTVKTSALYKSGAQIDYNNHYAYIIGYEDGTVRPENNITRAEVATIFFRLLTDESRVQYWSTDNSFSDVSIENWYNNAISTAANAGIVNGYEDGTFRPNAFITRAEFATIASRFAAAAGVIPANFADISGHWAESYIKKAASVGWVNGYAEDNTFRPNNNITRAEAMTIINRMTYRIIDVSGISANAMKWSDNPESAWYYANVEEATNAHTYTRNAIGDNETWTAVTEHRDWSVLEKETADKAAAITGIDNGAFDAEGSVVVEEN